MTFMTCSNHRYFVHYFFNYADRRKEFTFVCHVVSGDRGQEAGGARPWSDRSAQLLRRQNLRAFRHFRSLEQSNFHVIQRKNVYIYIYIFLRQIIYKKIKRKLKHTALIEKKYIYKIEKRISSFLLEHLFPLNGARLLRLAPRYFSKIHLVYHRHLCKSILSAQVSILIDLLFLSHDIDSPPIFQIYFALPKILSSDKFQQII